MAGFLGGSRWQPSMASEFERIGWFVMAKQYTNKRPSTVTVGGVNFVPGGTAEVSDEIAAKLESKDGQGNFKHPLRMGADPILVPGKVELPPSPDDKPAPVVLHEDLTKAQAQIRMCTDPKQLFDWEQSDKRPEIQAAIKLRSGQLAAQPPKS